MEKINHDWFRTAIRIAFIAFTVGGVPLSQAAADAKYMYVTNTSGVRILVPVPVSGEAIPRGNGQLLWDRAVNTDGGQPKVSGTGTLKNPSGRAVPVSGTARIPGAAIGKAVGRAFGKALPGIGAAIALKELAEELDFLLGVNPDGSVKVQKEDPVSCTVAPCYQYRLSSDTPYFRSRQAAVDAWLSVKNQSITEQWRSTGVTTTGGAGHGIAQTQFALNSSPNNWVNSEKWFGAESVAPLSSADMLPSTMQQLIDAIASKSGWPSGSKVNEVLRQDLESNGPLEAGPISVSGPATSPGAVTTTSNTTNNTTTTSTTTHHHTYAGDTVTTTNNTTTTTINNTTGDTITNTSTTTEPPPEEEKCKEGDQTIGCAESDTPELETPKETKTVTYSEENVFGSGSCPADLTATLGTLGQTVKVWDWQKTCNLALPLRALVLALAGFAALLIVMPGSRTV